MYTSHPPGNIIVSVSPERLAEASRHVHAIHFDALVEIHAAIRDLAKMVNEFNPTFVVFFATGGIPIVFPLMHVLSENGRQDLTSGEVFHMFPGLAWDGEIDGMRPDAYFIQEVVPLLRRAAEEGRRHRIIAIDTTNSGNAVNLATGAINSACAGAGIAGADVFIVGVVNGARVAVENEGNQSPVLRQDGTLAYVFTPSGYSPDAELRDRVFVRFTANADQGLGAVELNIAYWVVDSLFTEDNAELVGIAAAQHNLFIRATGAPGRMEIEVDNGRKMIESGLAAVGVRVLSLLRNERTSAGWKMLEKLNALGPETEEERAFREESALDRDAFMSILEMNENPERTLEHLLEVRALLTSVQIYCIFTQQELPEEATPRVIAALRAARPGRSDGDDQTIVEASKYLRRAYPQLGGSPALDRVAELRTWWLAALARPPRSR